MFPKLTLFAVALCVAFSAFTAHGSPQQLLTNQSSAFLENYGQWDSQILFASSNNGINVVVTKDGVFYDFYKNQDGERVGHVVKMEFTDVNLNSRYALENPQSTRYNYFKGNDPSKWISNLTKFEKLIISNVYDGISAVLYFQNNVPRYDFVVAPNADPEKIKLNFLGADNVRYDSNGDLIISTSFGDITNSDLFAYQETDGERKKIDCQFNVFNGQVHFIVGEYDKSKELIIDPLVYGTYFGGSGNDEIRKVIARNDSEILFAGNTNSESLKTTPGIYGEQFVGLNDGFIGRIRVTPTGTSITRLTYLGSNGDDFINSLSADAQGNVYAAGSTNGFDFPAMSSFNNTYGGGNDAFITKLNPEMTQIIFSGFVGGGGDDIAWDMKTQNDGTVIMVGETSSSDFPLIGGLDEVARNGGKEAFVVKINRSGLSYEFSTILSGGDDDIAYGMDLGATGNIHVVGATKSINFPFAPFRRQRVGFNWVNTQEPYSMVYRGGWDTFVSVLNSTGATFEYSTYFGGRGDDIAKAVVAGSDGSSFVIGTTTDEGANPDFPITDNAYGFEYYGGSNDMFYLHMDIPRTSSSNNWIRQKVNAVSFIGGRGAERVHGLVENKSTGNLVAYGATNSNNFPRLDPDARYSGGYDAFIIEIAKNASNVPWSTMYGGTRDDDATGVVYDSEGNYLTVGFTRSTDFRALNDFSGQQNAGGADGIIMKNVDGSLGLNTPADGTSACPGSTVAMSWSSNRIDATRGFTVAMQIKGSQDIVVLAEGLKSTTFNVEIPENVPAGSEVLLMVGHPTGIMSGLKSGIKINEQARIESVSLKSEDNTICEGDVIEIVATATANTSRYVWRLNGNVITGQNTNTLRIQNATQANQGTYTVMAEGSCQPFHTGEPVEVSVARKTSITKDLASEIMVQEDKKLELEIIGQGTEITYQWMKNGEPIQGATAAKFVVESAKLTDAGDYNCMVYGSCGTAESNIIKVEIDPAGSVADGRAFGNLDFVSLSILKNGTNYFASIESKEACNLNLELIDISGRVIANINQGFIGNGRTEVNLDNYLNSTGTYVLVANCSEQRSAISFQFIKD